ncbi:MAG: DEAD/DEAH box helicase [Bacteroidales bacterium]
MTFEELNLKKPFIQALNDLEYIHPTPIQQEAFAVIMSGRNVIGTAQTGTGKTFAYLLPLLNLLPFSNQREPRILILAPTRVLVVQITNEIKKLTKYTQIRSAGVYGDTNINTQKQVVYNGLDVLVATPGRLIDLTFTGVLRLKSIKKLVIDEVDEMMSMGLNNQLKNIIELLPKKRQNLMFSATIPPEMNQLIEKDFITPVKIEVAPHGTPLERIIQVAYHAPNFHTKVNLLELLLKEDENLSKVLIFVNSKKVADQLYDKVEQLFPNQAGVVHSNKTHNKRISSLKNFENGTHRILIATDVVARGMDIINVTHVVNFELPDTAGDYLHRVGRTGRANKDGVAISFISENEQEYQLEVEEMMGKNITLKPLPENLIISEVLTDAEKPKNLGDKHYLKAPKTSKQNPGAFHEKKAKNKKVNLGGPKLRKEKLKKLQEQKRKRTRKTRF